MKKKSIKIFLIFSGIIFFSCFSFCLAQNSDFFHLTWESDGSVPLDYNSKALVSDMGVIKVSIQPFIFSNGYSNVNNLRFRWYLNDKFVREEIGLKDFRFRADNYGLRNYNVKVDIVFPNNNIRTEEIEIPIVEPEVIILPQNIEYTLKDKILSISENNFSLSVIPYFFSETLNFLKYQWFLNGALQRFGDNNIDDLIIERFNDEIDIEVLVSSNSDSLVRGIGELKILFTNPQIDEQLEEL